ncbi:MAG: hypothetical protein AB2799_19190 [Candidatus Thiodiazotropha sp.]
MVKIRAKSILKLDTGATNLDYEYTKETPIDEVAKHLIHAVIYNKGVKETKAFIDEFIGTYDPEYGGS